MNRWKRATGLLLFSFFLAFGIISCKSTRSRVEGTPLSISEPVQDGQPQIGGPPAGGAAGGPAGPPAGSPAGGSAGGPAGGPAGGIAEEIRLLVENGSPASLIRAMDLIRERELGNSEFGRVMNAVAVSLMQGLYPDIRTMLPAFDPPQTHAYTRILREAAAGRYTPPQFSSQDCLEFTLPFLAYLNETRPQILLNAMPDLVRAGEINPDSVLAVYFLGLLYERSGRLDESRAAYARILENSQEYYPAALGEARLLLLSGKRGDAIRLLTDTLTDFPDNNAVKRQLAIAYYENRDWSRAESAVAEILQRNPRDGQFILMRAHILVEQGQYLQAQTPLDLYGAIDSANRLYLFLRARIQFEAYRNRDAALNYLRSLLRNHPNDDEGAVYAAGLLMESSRPEDQSEGRALMQRLSGAENPSPRVVELALTDAIRREAWRDAQTYLNTLLARRRSPQDLLNGYLVQRGLGNNAAALSFARELLERDPSNEDGALAYISALIDTGRRDEANSMIDSRLASVPGGSIKSKYYYQKSRVRTEDEQVMNELRQSLFEDPRNLDALIAMFEIYHRRRDERRAVYYLKQALAIAPGHPRLQRYRSEYSSLL